MWPQFLLVNHVISEPFTLGWQATVIATNKYMLMRQVLKLIRCMCGSNSVESTSKCSCRCSCNRNSLVCTELCNCAEDDKCQNTEPMLMRDFQTWLITQVTAARGAACQFPSELPVCPGCSVYNSQAAEQVIQGT